MLCPYLLISINELLISIISFNDINKYGLNVKTAAHTAGCTWRAARDATQTEENTHERAVARIIFDSIYRFSQQENITRVVI